MTDRFIDFLNKIQQDASNLMDAEIDNFNSGALLTLKELSSELLIEYELCCMHRVLPEDAFEYAFIMGCRAAQLGLAETSKYTLEKEKRRLTGINTGGKNRAAWHRKADEHYALEAKPIILDLLARYPGAKRNFLITQTMKKLKDDVTVSSSTIGRYIDKLVEKGEIALSKKV